MLPIRLEIKNFLAYRSPDPVRFDGIHLACLTGSNGAGKSSMLDAITWALWGKARARRDEELVHMGQSDMYVQLDFEQEGIIYSVIRRRTRRSGGQGTLDLFSVDEEGNRINLNEPNMRATQGKINRLLNLDYDTFTNSAFLQQGKADAFTTKQPADRKRILADILNLNRWADYEVAAKNRISDLTEDINVCTMRINEIDGELKREPQLKTALEEAEAAQQAAEAQLVGAEAKLKEVEHAPADLRAAQEQCAGIEARLRNYAGDLAAVDGDIARQQERIATYERVLEERDQIQTGYAELQAARESDHVFGDKLRQWSDVESSRHDIERQIDAVRSEIEREIRACETNVQALNTTIAAAKPDDLAAVQAEVATLEDLDAQRDTFDAEISAATKESADLKADHRTLHNQMNEIKAHQQRLSAVDGATCPYCGQPLEESRRLEIIAEREAEGKTLGDQWRANKTRVEELETIIAERTKAVGEIRVEIRRLSALRERAGQLNAGVEAALKAEIQLEEVRAKLDQLRETLEQEQYAADLRGQLAALIAKRDELGYDRSEHSAVREKLETYQVYETRQKELMLALEALPDATAAYDAAQARRERIVQAQAEEEAALEAARARIVKLEALVKQHQERQLEVNRLRLAERQAYDKLSSARQDLNALDELRRRRTEIETTLYEKREERAVYEELMLAFGKNGIPAMIIETAIPELESSANRLLSRMTDGRMNLTMSTQREKLSGGVSETLDIQIADELGTRPYELFSGGEAFRINFAIRVALSQMLARRAGAHLRTLFIDEGFGTQDDEGRNKLVEAITAIQDDFDVIIVVTHIDELRDAFPVHLAVEKTSEGSQISVR